MAEPTYELPVETINALKKEFEEVSKDGSITINGMIKIVEKEGRSVGVNWMSRLMLSQMIKEADTDGNGLMDFSEFLAMWTKFYKAIENEDETSMKRLAFRAIDTDASGFIELA